MKYQMIIIAGVLMLSGKAVPAYAQQSNREKSASEEYLVTVTEAQMTQIDRVIDETVAQALAAQRAEYERALETAAADAARTARKNAGLLTFWRTAAVAECAGLAVLIIVGTVRQ